MKILSSQVRTYFRVRPEIVWAHLGALWAHCAPKGPYVVDGVGPVRGQHGYVGASGRGMSGEREARPGGACSASVVAMAISPRDLRVPADTPVVLHRHGPGRYSVAVVVDGAKGYLSEGEAREALAKWQALLGGWMTKRRAAEALGLSAKMIDALRRNGRLDSKNVHGQVRITIASVQRELRRRRQLTADSDKSNSEVQ